jgi:hypothetical protein
MNRMPYPYSLSIMIVLVIYDLAWSQPPEVTFTTPLAVAPGEITELALHGKHLENVTRLWTGFAADTTFEHLLTSESGSKSQEVRAAVQVTHDVPVGIYAARVATVVGVSAPILLMVDDLPSIREQTDNHRSESAQLLHHPISVDGTGDGIESDFFCVDVSAGEWLSIEVVATRLGFPFDPVLSVRDERGREVASADDTPGLNGDCRIRFQSSKEERYWIEVHDATYARSVRHHYRLRIGDFPLVTTTFPLGITTDAESSGAEVAEKRFLAFCSEDGSTVPLTRLDSQTLDASSPVPIGTKFTETGGSGFARYVTSSLLNLNLDQEVNGNWDEKSSEYVVGNTTTVSATKSSDTTKRAVCLESPVAVNGRFLVARDVHSFRLPLSAGSRRTIRGVTRSVGSPADLIVDVFDPNGALVSSHDDAQLDEATFEIHAQADGEYVLAIREIHGRHGSGFSYRLEITESRPGFRLSAKSDRVILGQGGVGLLPVQCERAGYDGPITLRIDDEEASYRLDNNVIQQGLNHTLLKIMPAKTLQPGDLHMIQVTGYGEGDGESAVARVSVVDAARSQIPSVPYPPPELVDQIAVAVARPLPDFFQLRPASEQVLLPRIVGDTYFTVYCVDRIEGFTAPIQVEAEGFPEGVRTSGNERPVGNSQNNEYRFEIRGPGDLSLGKREINIRAIGEFWGQSKEVVIPGIPFQVIDPLMMSLEISNDDEQPRELSIRVKARRFVGRAGGDRKEIVCTWIKRPDWLVGPERIVIGAGKNEETVIMSVMASDDPPPRIGQLVLMAETSVNGQIVRVESEPCEFRFPPADNSR